MSALRGPAAELLRDHRVRALQRGPTACRGPTALLPNLALENLENQGAALRAASAGAFRRPPAFGPAVGAGRSRHPTQDAASTSCGATPNIRSVLELFGRTGLDLRLAGLCDAARSATSAVAVSSGPASALPARAARWNGLAPSVRRRRRGRADPSPRRGCHGTDHRGSRRPRIVPHVPKQLAQLARTIEAQLRCLTGTRAGRKAHHAVLLVEALDRRRVFGHWTGCLLASPAIRPDLLQDRPRRR